MPCLVFLVVAVAAFFYLSLKGNDAPARGVLCYLAVAPFAAGQVMIAMATMGGHIASEQIVFVLAAALVGGALLAIPMAAAYAFAIKKGSVKFVFPWGFLLGAGFCPVRLLAMMGDREVSGLSSLLWVAAVIDGVTVGVVLSGLLGMIEDNRQKRSGLLILKVGSVPVLLVGSLFVPRALYRLNSAYSNLSGLQKVGANQYATGKGRIPEKARRDLLKSGDSTYLRGVLADYESYGKDYRVYDAIRALTPMTHNPEVRASLVAGFRAFVATYKSNGSDSFVLSAYLDAMAQMREPSVMPELIKILNASKGNWTESIKSREALASIGGEEVVKIAVQELSKRDRLMDVSEALPWKKMSDPRVRAAYESYEDARDVGAKARREREFPVSHYESQGNRDALKRRVNDKFGDAKPQAVIALIKLKDPDREKLLLKHVNRMWYSGRELKGFKDPQLAVSLSKRIDAQGRNADMYLARFLAGWAPPESCRTMGFLLRARNLRDASSALTSIGTDEAIAYMDQAARMQGSNSEGLLFAIVMDLGNSRNPKAIPVLKRYLTHVNPRGSMQVDRVLVHTQDAAAYGLSKFAQPEAASSIRDYKYVTDIGVYTKLDVTGY
ncbi:MAG: hypothetical protein ABL949_13520 [Fimbriimonadaceae bacterium]